MGTLGIKKVMEEIFRISFACGFAEGLKYAINGGDVSDRETLEKNIERKANELEARTFKNIEL